MRGLEKVGRGVGGGIVAGAEEDAVPLHVNTVQLDHKLTGL